MSNLIRYGVPRWPVDPTRVTSRQVGPLTTTVSGSTDTATVASKAWAGVVAASAASVVALATVSGLAWSGVPASSTAAGGGGYLTIGDRTATVAETASATSLSATMPSLVNGDVLIAEYGGSDTLANTTITTTGWTAIRTPIEFLGTRIIAAYIVVVPNAASPPTTPSASWVTAGRGSWIVKPYTNVDQATPLDVGTASYGSATQTLVLASITTVTPGARAISGAVVDSANTGVLTKPTEMTLQADTTGSGRRAQVADEVRATAGATGTRTWSHSTALTLAGWLTALRPAASGGGTTDTATVGRYTWAGVPATSAASVVSGSTVGRVSWAGVSAASTAGAVHTTRVASLAWSGVVAVSTALAGGVTDTARVGNLTWSGAGAASAAVVVSSTAVGRYSWAGVPAAATALAGGVTDIARLGSLAWSGVRADSASGALSGATVGRIAWSGVRAGSAADVTGPSRLGSLAWAGVPANSTTAVVQTDTARVGYMLWTGVRAVSVSVVVSPARVGAASWAGVGANSTSVGSNDGVPVPNPGMVLTAPAVATVLTSPIPGVTLSVATTATNLTVPAARTELT